MIDGNQIVGGKPLITSVIKHNFDIPDATGRKITGIPPTITREDPKNHFNKQYYIWHTCQDDKVRSSHAELDGTIHSTDEEIFPGKEYGCRCWAEEIS